MKWMHLALGPPLLFALSASAQEVPGDAPAAGPAVGGDPEGTPAERAPVEPSPPAMTTIGITPVGARTGDPLECVAEATDPNGDEVTFSYAWAVDGVVRASQTGSTLPAGAHAKGAEVRCTATPSDGTLTGEPGTASLVIGDTPPTVASAQVTPGEPATTHDLTCAASGGTDVDGDEISYRYAWLVGGADLGGALGSTLAAASTARDQDIACRVTPGAGGVDGEPATSPAIRILNTPPVLAGVSVGPESPTTGQELTCTPGEAADVDGDAVTFSYAWTVGGKVVQGANGERLAAEHHAKGQKVVCTVTPNDGGLDGAPVASASLTVGDTAPTLTAATVSPAEPTTTDLLTCTPGEASDPDDDKISFSYAWTVDGQAAGASATLAASAFNKGQEVVCTATPTAAGALGAPVTAAAVRIRNTPPVLASAAVSPADPATDADLVCEPGKVTDADGDEVTYAFAWTVDGADAGVDASTLPADRTKKHQSVVCTVTPTDGAAAGQAVVADPVVVKSSAPVLADVALTPEEPTTTDTLACAPGSAVDADGDEVAFTYAWTVAGRAVDGQAGATLAPEHFKKGQDVVCIVTPIDDDGPGAAVRSPARAAKNTPPALASAAIDNQAPTTTDGLACEPGEATDVDGDKVSFAFAWTVDGVDAGTRRDLAASAFRKGQSIACVVTPTDGTTQGEAITAAAVKVANTPPVLSGVTVTPSAPTAGVDLECKPARATDADGDEVTFVYAWTVDGVDAAVSASVLPAASVRKNQQVVCAVTPRDDEAAGQVVASEPVTVRNTAPVLASAAVTPGEPATTDALTCAPGAGSDADGDEIAYAYAWLVAGRAVDGQTGSGLAAEHFKRGQSVACAVTPRDDEAPGASVRSEAVVIKNTAPTLASAAVGLVSKGEGPFTTDDLECVPGEATDADGDRVSFTYAWTVQGKAAGTSQVLGAKAFAKGQEVACAAIPSDGSATGEPVAAAAVTIRNSAPVLADAKVTPDAPTTTDALTCAPGRATDADADEVSFTYAWTVDGQAKGGSASILAPEHFAKGQQVVCTVTPSDGTASGEAVAAAPVKIRNTVPVLAAVSVTPDAPLTTDDLSCKPGEATDADGDTVAFAYRWTVAGRALDESGPKLSRDQIKKNQAVTCAVTPRDDEAAGAPVASEPVRVLNTPPTLASAAITPAQAYATDTLTCTPGESADADGDSVSYAFAWSVGGEAVGATGKTLPSGAFVRDQQVVCTVTPKDGSDNGAPVATQALTIKNTPPVLASVQLGPEIAYTTTELACAPGRATDADGDEIGFTYTWRVDGQPIAHKGEALAPESFKKDQTVQCVVRPTDGTDSGEPVEGNVVTIQNSAPVVDEALLGPEAVYTEGVISSTVRAHDDDGDPVTLSYRWLVDGRAVEGQTGETLDGKQFFDRDQGVVIEVTPNDGRVNGAAVASEALIVRNTPPTGVMVFINDPDGGYSDVRCHVAGESTDIDGDEVSYRFAYFVDGEPYTGTTKTSAHRGDTVPAGSMERDQRWTCRGTPTDGTDDGPSAEFHATIIYGEAGGGSSHSCSLSTLGQLSCWGLDDYKVATPPEAMTFRRLAPGGWHNCALAIEDGKVHCWGHNTYDQDEPPDADWAEITSGWWHSCGLTKSGEVKCWGQSADGRIAVPPGRYKAVDAGGQHTCAITAAGAAACWGDDKFGQSSPPAGTFTAISAGENHSCGVKTDGGLVCWGSNDSGQTQAPAGTFSTVAAAARHNCAVRVSDKRLLCWGLDNYAQLTPPDSSFRMIGKGFGHSCGVDQRGSVACWGKDNYNQVKVPAWLDRAPDGGEVVEQESERP